MNVKSSVKNIISEISSVMEEINENTVEEVISEILKANKIFIVGAGRSGLVGKAFAMRLMQIGLRVYVVGETITPSMEEGDLLIAISNSGETRSVCLASQIAMSIKGNIVGITSNKNSRLAKKATKSIIIDTKHRTDPNRFVQKGFHNEVPSFAPLGTLFEVSTFLFFEGLIGSLMERMNRKEEDLKKMHSVLE
ncbi:MAG: 6-phospho-3-hexuloisomerase [Candidatus Methanofastidiosa archaeon]|nr:6-phospho-3-hexuloisomerase [Candidatus Methanofastidiosa archaeon]